MQSCKFRPTDNKLPMENGSWKFFYGKFSQKNKIGDQYHYIFECINLSEKRKLLLPKHKIKLPKIIKLKRKYWLGSPNQSCKNYVNLLDK